MHEIITRLRDLRKCGVRLLVAGAVLLAALAFVADARTHAQGGGDPQGDEAKARIGLAISPVDLDLQGKNRGLVGLGSYIVNAQAQCSNCHTQPQFVAGVNPFLGEPEEINTAGYLAGGRVFPVFGGVVSRNITPDPETGRPAGMTFDEFQAVIRNGEDTKHLAPHVPSADNDLLQVMQWPIFRYMSERDLRAVYEYLRAIPTTVLRETYHADDCFRDCIALAAAQRRDVAGLSARPPERAHPVAAGSDREASWGAPAGTAARARGTAGWHARAGI